MFVRIFKRKKLKKDERDPCVLAYIGQMETFNLFFDVFKVFERRGRRPMY